MLISKLNVKLTQAKKRVIEAENDVKQAKADMPTGAPRRVYKTYSRFSPQVWEGKKGDIVTMRPWLAPTVHGFEETLREALDEQDQADQRDFETRRQLSAGAGGGQAGPGPKKEGGGCALM